MEQAKFDKKIANLYDEVIRNGYHKENIYIAELRKIIPKNSSVLEIGCGTGEITIPLHNSGIKCEGLDISDNMLSRLKEKSNLKTYLTDAQNFIPEKNYDFTLSCSGPFSIKENELESYILNFDKARKCMTSSTP